VIGIRPVRPNDETVSSHADKQCQDTAMTRTELELENSSMAQTSTPELADFPVKTIEKLRFADTDRLGHITNTVFAVCCQNARMELLCDPRRVPIPRNTQFVIAKLVLEFRAEMHWPGTVEIGTRVERVGRSSVALAQALFVKQACVAIADSVVALMDMTTRRPATLPEETKEALRAMGWLSSGQMPTAAASVTVLHR
jgi:acyl-CoA thioester hydrolase